MTEIKKENEQIHEESSQMTEIKKENEQMHKESSSEDSEEEYQDVPSWISAKDKIDINSTDPVDRALRKILEKLNKYSYYLWECERQIYVNTEYLGDHKPIVVTIGPKYRDTIEPDVMEVHKLKYLKDFVEGINSNVEKVVRANLEFVKYIGFMALADDHFSNDELIELMYNILDGCFIIELFLKNNNKLEKANDPLFKSEWVVCALSRDLILPNNQLPFWFLINLCRHLQHLVESYEDNNQLSFWFTKLASKFLKRISPNQKLNHKHHITSIVIQDLTSIVYGGLNWSFTDHDNNSNSDKDKKDGNDLQEKKKKDGDDKWNLVKSAIELEKFGVVFKMIEANDLFDIKFTNGVLKIPRIHIRYGTPYSIKVLQRYEQRHSQHRYLNNYLWFMNNLMKSPNDVQLLLHKGIIDNLSELSDDAAIHKFMKDICGSVMITRNNFRYIQLCMDLNLHCNRRRNAWMTKLKRDYCNSPWAIISVIGASLLLILTVAQTVFSAASYYNQS